MEISFEFKSLTPLQVSESTAIAITDEIKCIAENIAAPQHLNDLLISRAAIPLTALIVVCPDKAKSLFVQMLQQLAPHASEFMDSSIAIQRLVKDICPQLIAFAGVKAVYEHISEIFINLNTITCRSNDTVPVSNRIAESIFNMSKCWQEPFDGLLPW